MRSPSEEEIGGNGLLSKVLGDETAATLHWRARVALYSMRHTTARCGIHGLDTSSMGRRSGRQNFSFKGPTSLVSTECSHECTSSLELSPARLLSKLMVDLPKLFK